MKVKYIDTLSSPIQVIQGHVYECIGIEGNGNWYRIIDEEGEDYLYPAECFIVVNDDTPLSKLTIEDI